MPCSWHTLGFQLCERTSLSFTLVCGMHSRSAACSRDTLSVLHLCVGHILGFYFCVWGTLSFTTLYGTDSRFFIALCWTLSFYSCVWDTLSVFRVSLGTQSRLFFLLVCGLHSLLCLRVLQMPGFNLVCGTHSPFYACLWYPLSLFRFGPTLFYACVWGYTLCFTPICEIHSPFYAFAWDTLFVYCGCEGPSLGFPLVRLDTPYVLRLCVGHIPRFKLVCETHSLILAFLWNIICKFSKASSCRQNPVQLLSFLVTQPPITS